ncbi:hypothetical protein PINS_up002254 [Pythium insidiosum]|nr:hypothetical protein PINS_up002254 [Pythium insidiosum]
MGLTVHAFSEKSKFIKEDNGEHTSSSTGVRTRGRNDGSRDGGRSRQDSSAGLTTAASGATSATSSPPRSPSTVPSNRERTGSWSETTELNANFSPVARSEPTDNEDSMSISDDDERAPVSTTSSSADTKADTQSTSASTVPESSVTPACVFCEEMKTQSGRSKCLRCERGQSSTSVASTSANRNVEALHAFLRQANNA